MDVHPELIMATEKWSPDEEAPDFRIPNRNPLIFKGSSRGGSLDALWSQFFSHSRKLTWNPKNVPKRVENETHLHRGLRLQKKDIRYVMICVICHSNFQKSQNQNIALHPMFSNKNSCLTWKVFSQSLSIIFSITLIYPVWLLEALPGTFPWTLAASKGRMRIVQSK